MKRMISIAVLCAIALGIAAGCAGTTEVPMVPVETLSATSAPSPSGTEVPLVTPEPATAPSADQSDFASLIWEFSDDGDEASVEDLWDLGVTVCQLFDSGGGFGDVLTLTDEQAFSPEFAIAIAIASVTYICPEHDAKITKGIDDYLASPPRPVVSSSIRLN